MGKIRNVICNQAGWSGIDLKRGCTSLNSPGSPLLPRCIRGSRKYAATCLVGGTPACNAHLGRITPIPTSDPPNPLRHFPRISGNRRGAFRSLGSPPFVPAVAQSEDAHSPRPRPCRTRLCRAECPAMLTLTAPVSTSHDDLPIPRPALSIRRACQPPIEINHPLSIEAHHAA